MTHWQTALATPEVVELRRRRRIVTTVLMAVAAAGYLGFLGAFAYAPDAVTDTRPAGVPLSVWLLFGQFTLTWVLLAVHTRPCSAAGSGPRAGRSPSPRWPRSRSPTSSRWSPGW